MGFDFLDFGFPKSGTDWKSINGKPYITVSSKGRSNGLSTKINDGADFGPDTTLNATSPSQTGPPYSPTLGIQEAINYANSTGQTTIYFKNGVYQINITSSTWQTDPNSTSNSYIIYIPNNMLQGIKLIGEGFGGWGDVYKSDRIIPSSEYNTTIYFNFIDVTLPNGNNSGLYQMAPTSTNAVFGHSPVDAFIDGIEFKSSINSFSSNYFIAVNMNFASSFYGGTIKITTSSTTLTGMVNSAALVTPSANSQGGITFERIYIAGYYFGLDLGGGHVSILQLYVDTCIHAIVTKTYGHMSMILYANIQNVQYVINNLGTSQLSILNIDTEITTSYPIPFSSMFTTSNPVSGYFSFWQDVPALGFPSLGAIPQGAVIDFVGVKTPTTPAVPASGTAQQNTNPYAVNVYLYGGTVTEIQLTRDGTAYTVFSNATGLALSGQVYKLNPSDEITITYTSAPTWEWLSD